MIPDHRSNPRVLVLGASGMLGSAVVNVLSTSLHVDVIGVVRAANDHLYFNPEIRPKVISVKEFTSEASLVSLLESLKPKWVLNCVGAIKQKNERYSKENLVYLNSLLPHVVSRLCSDVGARFIHVSTDCVFSGGRGGYVESDSPDPTDDYGKSKVLGETCNDLDITLRTSLIGHEYKSKRSLIEWFLAQTSVNGFKNAIFSGVTTNEFARIVMSACILKEIPGGVYHVSAQAISKYCLLSLVKEIYGVNIKITPEDAFRIDRSLDSELFSRVTGYSPPDWREMIITMHEEWRKYYLGRQS